MNIGIVGLGLIGGSFAKAIQAGTGHTIIAVDHDQGVQQQAAADGLVSSVLNRSNLGQCNIILLALYPQAAIRYLREHAELIRAGAVVVDVCGVKRALCREIIPLADKHGFHFVGGHPMAGREVSGYQSARQDLFQGASMILVPQPDTPLQVKEKLEQLFRSIGFGSIRYSDQTEHDRMIAYTSQLAHVLSNAYVKSPLALHHQGFSAGSFQDMTRVAALNIEMWTELFLLNSDYLAEEIDALCSRLELYSEALHMEDQCRLKQLLQEGCSWKEKSAKE
jgi:prephenate dehydrogenase